jgi:hypothetical protein
MGCVFDRSGLTAGAPNASDGVGVDLPSDLAPADAPVVDSAPRLEATPIPADFIVPDQPGVEIVPVSAAALGQAFFNTKVPCVDKNGKADGSQIAVADSATVKLFDGKITMADAAAGTKAWVGGKPTATILFDINACDEEWPSGTSWSSAGLLVRGASLVSGELKLSAGTTVKDINLLDIHGDGKWQNEFAKPDDSLLHTYPQLVNPTQKAKELVLKLAGL